MLYLYNTRVCLVSLRAEQLSTFIKSRLKKQDLYMTGMLSGPPSEVLVKSYRVQSQLTLWCMAVPPPLPLDVLGPELQCLLKVKEDLS